MTEEEALEYIKTRLRYYIESTDDNIALSIAVKALEKQIPKKLFVEKVEGTKIYYCPCCTEKLMEIGFANIKRQVLIPGRPTHCYICGQRLDWEAENDKTIL